MLADLPPSSRVTRFIVLDAAWIIDRPVSVEPVKLTLLTPGCSARALPTRAPEPVRTCSASPTTPSSFTIWPRRTVDSGVRAAGLTITALPQARAGAIPHDAIGRGKFHGEMTATTPIGSRKVML